MNKRSIYTLLALLLVIGLLSSSFFTVDETELGVITRFGKPQQQVRTPGFNMKLPWPVDRIYRVDQRRLIMAVETLELLTDDKKSILIEGFMLWRITNPIRFIETVKDRTNAEQRLKDLYAARLGAAVGNLPMDSFVSVGLSKVEFHQVVSSVKEKINAVASAHFGLTVEHMDISGFTLPPQNRASVISRMRAERSRIAARYLSEGAEQALKIESKAAAEHERILAEAHAHASIILGQADADALKTLSVAYGQDPEFYKFIRSLESYEAIIGENTTLFLESDSKLLSVLSGNEK